MATRVVVRPRRVRTAYRPALASLEPVMPHRRTSSLFAAAASAATSAVTRLTATTAAAGRVSTIAAVSVVSVTAALALAAPAASAAPIPLPYHWSGDGIIGAGHHPTADHHGLTGHGTPVDHGTPVGHGTPVDHGTPVGRVTPVDHDARVDHGTPVRDHAPTDHLTVTVHHSGSAAANGTFELYCHPGGGNHRHVKRACDKLDGMTKWGKDPFAPVPQGVNCTMMYGGPATAHVTGTWAGRPVNADFRRTNGCEISRWSRFEPLLPSTRS
ncbi:SSI family serine proteinase inhibitor [Streptomyces sp. NPDC054786]